MNDFQSIQTTTGSTLTMLSTHTSATAFATLVAGTLVGRDSMARCDRHSSRGWTIPVEGKSSNKTSEGDSTILDTMYIQDYTEIEVTSA